MYVEFDSVVLFGGVFVDVFDFLFDGGGWFVLGEVGVYMFGGEVVCSRGGVVEI